MATILEQFAEKQVAAEAALLGGIKDRPTFESSLAILRSQFEANCPVRLNWREAIGSPDMQPLFPHILSDIIYKPKEPYMIGQTLLARTIPIDSTRMVRFYSMGALRAHGPLAIGQEYPDESLALAQHQMEIQVQKFGLKVSLPDEVVEDSMWPLFQMYVEQMGFAMARLKEEQIFAAMQYHGWTAYDNASTDSTKHTTGKGTDGKTANGSLHLNDLLKGMGGLVANGYGITDALLHPMAWTIMATDPILRNLWITGGQVGQAVWTQTPQFNQQVNFPWSVNYQVTPFMPFTQAYSFAGGGTAVTGSHDVTDIYLIDRNQACVILQRDPISMDSWEDLTRDARTMKLKERYAVAIPNSGRAVTCIKNVVLETNYAPVTTVLSVTP